MHQTNVKILPVINFSVGLTSALFIVRAYYVGGKEAYCLHFEPGGTDFHVPGGGDGNGMITQYIWDVVFS